MANLHYEILGPEKPNLYPLFCLHTIPLDSWYFKKSLENIELTRPVYLIDLPNHGKSDDLSIEILDFEHMAEEIRELQKDLRLGEISILGHGVGGFVAQHFILKYSENVKSLILINSAGDNKYRKVMGWNIRDQYSKVTIQALNEYRDQTDDKSLRIRFTQALATYFHPNDSEKAKMIMDNATRIATQAYVHLGSNVIPYHSLRDKLKNITTTTLIVGCNNDVWPIESSKILKNDIIHAEYLEIDTGHFPMLEEPNKFWNIVMKFLK